MKSSYYDKLVKGYYGEEIRENMKAGDNITARFIAQGCKGEKGTENTDFETCMVCEFGIDFNVSK
jgi:hypothetical protein